MLAKTRSEHFNTFHPSFVSFSTIANTSCSFPRDYCSWVLTKNKSNFLSLLTLITFPMLWYSTVSHSSSTFVHSLNLPCLITVTLYLIWLYTVTGRNAQSG